MKQCALSCGEQRTILWIEDRGAKKGASVELIGVGFWHVDEVYAFHMQESDLREKQRMDRGSLPSIIGAKG